LYKKSKGGMIEGSMFLPKKARLTIRKGYLAPPVVIVLAIIVLFVAATLIINAKLFPKSKPSPTPTTQPSPLPSPSPLDETANWKTYKNKLFGYQIKYPQEWFIQGPYGGQAGGECVEGLTDVALTEFSRSKLKDCGFIAEQLPPQEADITIWVQKEEYDDLSAILIGQPKENITIAGIDAVKYPFTEKSEFPNIQATRIYFNHTGKGYLIFIKQKDKLGNYDPFFDQILSTFQFLD